MVPKDAARFHLNPDSVLGFQPDEDIDSKGTVKLESVEGHSERGRRSLAIRYEHTAPGRVARVTTPTFIPPEAIDMSDYAPLASPTLPRTRGKPELSQTAATTEPSPAGSLSAHTTVTTSSLPSADPKQS